MAIDLDSVLPLGAKKPRLTEISIREDNGLSLVRTSRGETRRAGLGDVIKWLNEWDGVEESGLAQAAMPVTGAIWLTGAFKAINRYPEDSRTLLVATERIDGGKTWKSEPMKAPLNFPPIWFYCELDRLGKLIASGIWIELAPAPSWADASVVAWPWGNAWQNGKICWGSVEMPKEKLTPQTLFDMFITSAFNQDLIIWPRPTTQANLDNQLTAGRNSAVGRPLKTVLDNIYRSI